jgi:anaerobic magnesium-protoporphyrin IX monomethyl ester cyclase
VADITLVNLNMLFMRYGEEVERELHVPLGPLYLTRALEDAGFAVDFRDYQCVASDTPFDMEVFLDFLRDPAPVIGLSCMANLLPFTLLAMQAIRRRYPQCTVVLGGVGSKAVEEKLLTRFPWVNIICRGEAERSGPELLRTLQTGGDLASVPGISFRTNGHVVHTASAPRIADLDSIPFPAFEKVELARYNGYGMMTSRGCPYPCTFCSVAPVWNLESYSRGPKNIVDEMEFLHREAGVDLFLFQDEFFVSGKRQVMEFCRELRVREIQVHWKAFGRVNLVDDEMMRAMADNGCVELRFGIESGSDRVLKLIKKGFTTAETLEVVPRAVEIFRRVDAFFVWGFPFETMEDFHQSLFQMVSFRMMGARILPSLLSLLPQTEIYREWSQQVELEFCPYLLPEFVFTGHEVCRGGRIELPERYGEYFRLITSNPDVFPGFFHIDLANNVLPKLELLRQFGFYPEPEPAAAAESCGAHSPRVEPQALATRADPLPAGRRETPTRAPKRYPQRRPSSQPCDN